MNPQLQVALDFYNLSRALGVAEEAVAGGADWIEAGTPLIKSEGLDAVRKLKSKFPDKVIVADMKTMDAGRIEVEIAAKAGADVVGVLGAASDSTIRECLETAENYGCKVVVDLIGVADIAKRALEVEKLGAHYVGVHVAIDEQMVGVSPFDRLRQVAQNVSIPICVAGGINSETAAEAVKSGASVVVVGGAITKSSDAKKAAEEIKKAILEGIAIRTELYKRATDENLTEILLKVSTANIADAQHRSGELLGISPVWQGAKMAGPAMTVRTYHGDWAKPVEAIDQANPGDVIVIEAGGTPPAVWGELATHSSVQRKLAGVVIDGAIRDVAEIRKLKFPAFSKLISPTAWEPKGMGEIGAPITISGQKIHPGDWIVGDDDGVVVIPQKKAVEMANRAMSVLELENRLRKEIDEGGTLSEVSELLKWEQK